MSAVINLILAFSVMILSYSLVRFPFIWGSASFTLSNSSKIKAGIVSLLGAFVGTMIGIIPLINLLTAPIVFYTDYFYFKKYYDADTFAALITTFMVSIFYNVVLLVIGLIWLAKVYPYT